MTSLKWYPSVVGSFRERTGLRSAESHLVTDTSTCYKMPPSSQPVSEDHKDDAEARARVKDMARESRFTFRNLAEHQLRRELKEEAMELCNPEIKDFAECAQEKGLMVVFSCKSLFQKVNECMQLHNGEEAWQKYKAKHADEIERRARFG
jgi:Cytochrome c oxidase biogenesis protein Cmc1 like